MKIAMITRRFPSFSETFMIRAIDGLLDNGHNIDIFAFTNGSGGIVQETVEKHGLTDRVQYLNEIPKLRWPRIQGAFRIILKEANKKNIWPAINIFKYGFAGLGYRIHWLSCPPNERNYDIIHAHGGENGVVAAWWREVSLINGKIVTTFQGLDINRRKDGAKAYKLLFQKGDAFTANSRFTAENAIRKGCPRERLNILPIGIDINHYEFQQKHISSNQTIQLLTVCRLNENKGIDYSIRAIAEIFSKRTNVCYKIAGEGPERDKLEHLIKVLELGDRVKLIGWKTEEELKDLYKKSHIFIQASITSKYGHQEARGLSLQEAQACGLPVVSTNTGGIPESIIHGETGYLVPERDVQSLTERITYLIEHPNILSNMSYASRKHMESMYRIHNPVKRLLEIYESII